MTNEEKITWLENANNDELLNQYKWSVIRMHDSNSTIAEQYEANIDFELALAELKKRLAK